MTSLRPNPDIVAIVASTGGPRTVGEIIGHLPSSFRLPIVVVQHITFDFVNPMVSWLNTFSTLPVCVANSGESPAPGKIYFAPGRTHIRLTRDRRFELSDMPNNVPHIPSGDVLFESVARSYGPAALGIILTGMGNDGAQGLRNMYDAGAMTIAQEGSTCVVFGMPQEAIMLGAARQTLTPAQIADYLLQYAS
jgi:two-component system chemotaxis response regulator CheB